MGAEPVLCHFIMRRIGFVTLQGLPREWSWSQAAVNRPAQLLVRAFNL